MKTAKRHLKMPIRTFENGQKTFENAHSDIGPKNNRTQGPLDARTHGRSGSWTRRHQTKLATETTDFVPRVSPTCVKAMVSYALLIIYLSRVALLPETPNSLLCPYNFAHRHSVRWTSWCTSLHLPIGPAIANKTKHCHCNPTMHDYAHSQPHSIGIA